MVIAIDWDGTITNDAELFALFMGLAHKGGHTPIVVTQRSEEQGKEIKSFLKLVSEKFSIVVPVVWAYGFTKDEATKDAGFNVDVWVEDNPMAVFVPMMYRGDIESDDISSEEIDKDSNITD